MTTKNPTDELIRQLDSVRRYNSEQCEQYNKVVVQRDILIDALKVAKIQLEYLDEKFIKTGTTTQTLAIINNALEQVEENKNE